MNITQVYLTLNDKEYNLAERSSYQKKSNYLSLFISEKIKSLRLDLGNFNSIIFREGRDHIQDQDMSVVGEKAFLVTLDSEFKALQENPTNEALHEYFKNKYLEGISKFDKKFNLSLKNQLQPEIESAFKDKLKYEFPAKDKKYKGVTIRALHRYTPDHYSLVAQELDNDKLLKEEVICTCEPDPFLAKFKVNKIEIKNNFIFVTNGIDETHTTHNLLSTSKKTAL